MINVLAKVHQEFAITHNLALENDLIAWSIDHERSFSSARFPVIGELLVNFGQNVNHKCMEKKNYLHFSPSTPLSTAALPISNES